MTSESSENKDIILKGYQWIIDLINSKQLSQVLARHDAAINVANSLSAGDDADMNTFIIGEFLGNNTDAHEQLSNGIYKGKRKKTLREVSRAISLIGNLNKVAKDVRASL